MAMDIDKTSESHDTSVGIGSRPRLTNGTRNSLLFFFIIIISFARPASPYCDEHVYTVYVHIADCVEIVYKLSLLTNNIES
jgi:hypothetical protein